MMKKDKFSKLTRPNATPTEVKDIGMSHMFTGDSITKEKVAEIQARIQDPTSIKTPKVLESTVENENIISSIIPQITTERLIDRNLLFRAPDEWNFFGKPDEQTFDLLINSIIREGLLTPLLVWEQKDGKYMILSGHTRELCYNALYQATLDDKYKTIPCKVYKYDQLDDTSARRIIIISNIAQRAKESNKIRIRSIGELAKLEKTKTSYGSGIDVASIVAEITGCSRTTIFNYKRIDGLIDPLLNAFCDNHISLRVALIIASYPKEIQEYIYTEQLFVTLNEAKFKLAKEATTLEEFKELISQEIPTYKNGGFYQVRLKYKKPKNSSIIPICIKDEDKDLFISTLLSLVNISDFSEDTKKLILKQINNK